MVAIDTSFLVSFILKSDVFHNQTISLFERIIEENEIIVVNNFVISELITLANIKYPKYKVIFSKFILELVSANNLYLVDFVDPSVFNKILQITIANNISFTDNSVILTALKYKNSKLLSYDKTQLTLFEQYKKEQENKLGFFVEDKGKKRYSSKVKK